MPLHKTIRLISHACQGRTGASKQAARHVLRPGRSHTTLTCSTAVRARSQLYDRGDAERSSAPARTPPRVAQNTSTGRERERERERERARRRERELENEGSVQNRFSLILTVSVILWYGRVSLCRGACRYGVGLFSNAMHIVFMYFIM